MRTSPVRALLSSFLVALGCNVYDPILGEPLADGGNEGGWMLNPKGTVGTGGSSGGSGGIASASVSSSSATTSATGGTGIDSGHEGDSGAGGQQGGAGGEGGTAGTGGAVAVGGAGGAGGQAGTGGAAGSGMAGAPDAGTEAGAMGCPTSVVLSGEFATSMHGGADATDMLFKDACPQGGPVIGYTGSVDSRAPASIGRIATICGKLAVVSTPNGCQITVSSGSTLPLRGQYGDSPFTQRCPTNQVVVGMRGRAGVYLDQASFVCAPLVVSSGPMGYSLSIGATTVLTPAGGTGGSAFQDGCPAGQIARGSNVTVVSGIVDAMGLVCGTPSLTGP